MTPLPSLQQLRFLSALAEHKHFGRAAAACAVTQSTLSAGLQELEERLGVSLVERSRRHVLLTPWAERSSRAAGGLWRVAGVFPRGGRARRDPLPRPFALGAC